MPEGPAERLMTYEEWNREMLVRGCKSEGHPPSDVVRASLGVAVYATCRCGEVRWVPQLIKGEEPESTPSKSRSNQKRHRR